MLEFGQEIGKEGPCCEEVMDELRTIVLWASELKEFPDEIFTLINETSLKIARDIQLEGRVRGETLKIEHSPKLDVVLSNFKEVCVFEEW